MEQLKNKIYLRPNEASEITGISKSHIWSLIKKGILPSFAPSPKVRLIKSKDLVFYIEKSKKKVDLDEN
ncbi:helix-turn-helix transcriptional regulator [Arcobacter sp. YIC-310]|uniref:helix-turn-helix transcriptional regulator n=1 Tax=Arcobacter sp. YIC-310 TaxID=3376632 RepID=UPI003C153B8B